MHTVFALLCFVVVIHWLIVPYPSGLLHWHCGNLTIAPVPAKQPWWIWINTSCEFIMNDCITTTKQSTTKPCAYFLGYTVYASVLFVIPLPSTNDIPQLTSSRFFQNSPWRWNLQNSRPLVDSVELEVQVYFPHSMLRCSWLWVGITYVCFIPRILPVFAVGLGTNRDFFIHVKIIVWMALT